MTGDYSIQTGNKRELGILDYVLLILLFVVSAAIGVYHAYKDKRNTDVVNFHLGGRKMHLVPVTLSLAATFMSPVAIVGFPVEMYTYGTMLYWIILSFLIACAGAAHVFLPVFYRMNIISCFGYLELRFGTLTRLVASFLFLLQTLLFMGTILYLPSLAFQAVTSASLWGSMVGAASVCTLYTMLGGMKTVLWTDSLQFVIMVMGLLALVIEGSSAAGGLTKAWEIAAERGRIELTNFSADPRTRHSVWSVGIGGGIFWSYLYGVNQAQVQRACSLPSLRSAQIAIWLNFPALTLIVTLAMMIGVVMYAFYSECDPVKFGLIDKNDQLVPLMVLDVLGTIPGMSGLFMACIFSGSLSSISSGLNAMSAVIMKDYICLCFKSLTGKKELILSKMIIFLTGITMFGVAVLISQASGIIIQLASTMIAVTGGPVLGCFIAGMIFPWNNKFGAVSGLVTSFAIMCWLGIGSKIDGPPGTKPLPVYTDGCYSVNSSNVSTRMSNMQTTPTVLNSTFSTEGNDAVPMEESLLHDFYRMSYQWYSAFGMLINIIVSLVVSFITGHTDPKTIDHKLMSPLFYNLCPWLPEKLRSYLRFGVNYEKTDIQCENSKDMKYFGKENIAYNIDTPL